MENIDIIIVSDSKTEELKKITENTIKSLYDSENNIIFKTYIVESSDADYSHLNKNIIMVKPTPPFGYNKYLNLGRKMGNSKYVCLCNNDLEFKNNWATNILKYMEKDEQLLSASPYSFNPHNSLFKLQQNGIIYGHQTVKYVAGWAIFQKRDIYNIIGDLDENFTFWYCDNDYSMELIKNKIKHALICDSFVEHITSVTLNKESKEIQQKLTTDQQSKFIKKWN